jgi:hypothetical protein
MTPYKIHALEPPRLFFFRGKFPPARLLEPQCVLVLGEITNCNIILSSFKLLFDCFKQVLNEVWLVKLIQFEVFESHKFDLKIIGAYYFRKNSTYTANRTSMFISFWKFFPTFMVNGTSKFISFWEFFLPSRY